MKIYVVVPLLLLLLLLSACKKSPNKPADINTSEIPAWVEDLIAAYESGTHADPSIRITIWQLADGKTYFYFTAQCCDQFNPLYDFDGGLVCHPDGGFSGQGDGTCPPIVTNIIDSRVIWEFPAPSP